MERDEEIRGALVDTAADTINRMGPLEAEAIDCVDRTISTAMRVLLGSGFTARAAMGFLVGKTMGTCIDTALANGERP